MKIQDINKLLAQTRDQKFRKHSDKRLQSMEGLKRINISNTDLKKCYRQWWGPERGKALRDKLAAEYQINVNYLGEMMQHPTRYMSLREAQEIQDYYQTHYEIRARVYTAGNDILPLLDTAYNSYTEFALGPIKPSLLYKLRYELDWERDREQIVQIGEQLGYGVKDIRTIRTKRWPWLQDIPSTVTELVGIQEINQFKKKHKINSEAWGWGSRTNTNGYNARGTKNWTRGYFKGKSAGLFWEVFNG
jgi:hypothetical protein